jgi:hypothetical protein
MAYALITDGAVAEYPFDPALLRSMFPSVSFPPVPSDEALAGFGVFPVEAAAPPNVTSDQVAEEAAPVKSGGKWRQAWAVRSRTADELAAAKRAKLAELAALRYEREVAGITFAGKVIPTDRQTCSILTGAYVQAAGNPAFAIKFKSPDGTFTPIGAAQIIAVGNAVTAHVQACFARESDLADAINAAADFAALAAIDTEAGWP